MVDKLRVLLVDDHGMIREGLRAMLSNQSDIEVVGEASTGEQAIELARQAQPEIVILDLNMPGMGGLAAIRVLRETVPNVAILVLTVDNSEAVLLEAIRAGASGYVLKAASAKYLLQSIRMVQEGGTLIPGELLRRALRGLSLEAVSTSQLLEIDKLTRRELDVLRLLAQGLNNHEIAAKLDISWVTAKQHVHHILSKLQVSDRTQAALKAVRMGLID